MASSFTIMRVRGIPIGVHWSWLIIFGIFVWSLTKVLYPAAYPGLDGATYLGMGIATALLFFGSVLLHELSHALLSEREGIHIEGISLWLLGGVARLRGQPGRPSTEARIAGVGPLVSVILGLLFGGLALLANRLGWPEPVRGVSSYLAQVNLILAGFNLVPALPLDGGRVLRAWLWDRQRSYYRATRSAVRAGKAFGIMLIALGVLGFLTGTDLGGLWFVLLGWFLIQAAQGEMEQAEARQALRGLRVRDVMRTGAVTVSPDRSVAAFLDDAGRNRGFSSYPVVDDRGLAGMVSVREVATVPAGQRQDRQVAGLMTPADQVPTVRLDDPAEDTLGVLGGDGHRAVVLEDDGRVVGMLTAADVARVLEWERRAGRRPAPEAGSRKAGPLVWLVVGAIMLVAIGLLYTPPFLVVSPGPTYAVEGDVTITGRPTTPVTGHYLAATVTLHQRTALGTLIAAVRPDREVIAASALLPKGVSAEEYEREQRQAYLDSRRVAAAAAARAVGLPVTISGSGVRVTQVAEGVPAAEVLRPDDVIVAVDGQRVQTLQQLQRIVRSHPAGTSFDLTVERGGQTVPVQVQSAELPDVAGGVGLGIAAETRDLKVDLPFEVQFAEREGVGGPSAGLVHALVIADLLDRTDYARGQDIAATGTVDVDGNVGPVGGVGEKADAVEDAGAELFLTPQSEVEQARNVEKGLTVRGVDRLQQALRVLAGQSEAA